MSRFCIDCKWCVVSETHERRTSFGVMITEEPEKLFRCTNEDACGRNLITGELYISTCDLCRYGAYGRCGVEGKFWEAKK